MTDLLKAEEIKTALEAFAGQWKDEHSKIRLKHTCNKNTHHCSGPTTKPFLQPEPQKHFQHSPETTDALLYN